MTNVQQEIEDSVVPTSDTPPDATAPTATDAGSDRMSRSAALVSWLRNPVNRWLKIQVAAAMLLILLVGSLTFVNTQRQTVRDAAYQQMVEAVTRGDTYAVLLRAEAYLAHPPLSRSDLRRAQVVELYSAALVDWFVATHTVPPSDRQKRIERYRALVLTNR